MGSASVWLNCVLTEDKQITASQGGNHDKNTFHLPRHHLNWLKNALENHDKSRSKCRLLPIYYFFEFRYDDKDTKSSPDKMAESAEPVEWKCATIVQRYRLTVVAFLICGNDWSWFYDFMKMRITLIRSIKVYFLNKTNQNYRKYF